MAHSSQSTNRRWPANSVLWVSRSSKSGLLHKGGQPGNQGGQQGRQGQHPYPWKSQSHRTQARSVEQLLWQEPGSAKSRVFARWVPGKASRGQWGRVRISKVHGWGTRHPYSAARAGTKAVALSLKAAPAAELLVQPSLQQQVTYAILLEIEKVKSSLHKN